MFKSVCVQHACVSACACGLWVCDDIKVGGCDRESSLPHSHELMTTSKEESPQALNTASAEGTKPPSSHHLLNFPRAPLNVEMGTRPLTHECVGHIPDRGHSKQPPPPALIDQVKPLKGLSMQSVKSFHISCQDIYDEFHDKAVFFQSFLPEMTQPQNSKVLKHL